MTPVRVSRIRILYRNTVPEYITSVISRYIFSVQIAGGQTGLPQVFDFDVLRRFEKISVEKFAKSCKHINIYL